MHAVSNRNTKGIPEAIANQYKVNVSDIHSTQMWQKYFAGVILMCFTGFRKPVSFLSKKVKSVNKMIV